MEKYAKEHIKWFKQGSLRFEDEGKTVYTDPFGIDASYNDADYVFITHSHYDHFSPEDIVKVIKKDTVFIAPESMKKEMKKFEDFSVKFVNTHERDVKLCEQVSFSTIPAYNTVKTKFHPKGNNWVGYIINIGNKTFYYAGDTEYVPEMEGISPDIAFIPIGSVYTMEGVAEAVKSAKATNAKAAVPVHFGGGEGSLEEAQKFCEFLDSEMETCIL